MEGKRLKTLSLEVFKTLNNINPEYMREIFHHKTNVSTHRPLNLEVNEKNTSKYGNNLGAHISKSLPI